jgi:sugar/nucleoside kinase (ribokinase family)
VPTFDITIAGEINLDIILSGLPPEMELERELIADGCSMTLGSSSAILAHNIAVLGAKTGFITRVGPDILGQSALQRLREAGVDLTHVSQSPTATGLTVILPHGNQRHILTYPGTMFEMSLRDLDLEYLADARHFHMSSLFLHRGLLRDIPDLFRRMKDAGLSTPNEREACKIAGLGDFHEAVASLAQRVSVVAVKRGPRGALARCGHEQIVVPPLTVEPVDTVGAGDSFNAGFLFARLRGEDLGSCLKFGNVAGALSALRAGGTEAFREPELVRHFLQSYG